MSRKIALVIGHGSVKCAAALGLMRVLAREGVEIDMVVASGGGSVFGSLIALGCDLEEIVELHQRLWAHEVAEQPNRLAVLQMVLPKILRAGKYFNLRDDRLLNQRLRLALGDYSFADVKIPLFITATDFRNGTQIVISDGSLYDAVRASIALPLIFPPHERAGQMLVDGYLSDPLPLGIAIKEGADIILAMRFESAPNEQRNSLSEYVLHLSGVISNNLLNASYAFYNLAHHSEVLLIMPNFESDIQMFDAEKLPEIIKAGEVEAEKIMPQLKHMLGTYSRCPK
jgi:NTE family protein